METDEIREGLKLALARGETLEKAMQGFYNAGYKKEEIEQAAISLKSSSDSLNTFLQNSKIQTKQNPVQQNNSNISKQSIQKTQQKNPQSVIKQQEVQTKSQTQESKTQVSAFQGSNDFSKRNLIMAFILIMFFIAAIIGIIYYKDQVVTFINNLIGENAS